MNNKHANGDYKALLEALIKEREGANLCTVQGEAIRRTTVKLLAVFYGITLPTEEPLPGEPDCMAQVRQAIIVSGFRWHNLFVLAFTEGYLAAFLGGDFEVKDPYQKMLTSHRISLKMKDCLCHIWQIGFEAGKTNVKI